MKEDNFELLHATSNFDQCLQQHLAGGQQELLRNEILCVYRSALMLCVHQRLAFILYLTV